MNKFLAEALGIMNALAAVVIFVCCAALGYLAMPIVVPAVAQAYGYQVAMRPDSLAAQGIIWGVGIGLLLAIGVCGFIALLIAMHQELKAIRALLKVRP